MNQGVEEEGTLHSPTPEESTFTLSSGGFELAAGDGGGERPWTFRQYQADPLGQQERTPPRGEEDHELSEDEPRTPLARLGLQKGGYALLPLGRNSGGGGDVGSRIGSPLSSIPTTTTSMSTSKPAPAPDTLSHFTRIHRLPRSTAV